MRLFLVLVSLAGLTPAQSTSHPSWWTYASPDSTALIGITWNHLRDSPFEATLTTELSPRGWLGFPDLEFLNQRADRILIASPYLMAIHAGTFPVDVVRGEAAAKGLKQSAYKNVELWVTPAKETMSLAWISEQIVVLGHLSTLKEAIDRTQDTETPREFSPLFARAAKYSTDDLWVVSGPLPDPVVGRFVPLKMPVVSLEGGLVLKEGLHLSAVLETSSEKAAETSSDRVWTSIDPKLFDSTQIFTDVQNILVKMDLTVEQVEALKPPPPPPVVEVVAPAPPKPARPPGPRVVKIQGLEDGPREYTVPAGAK